MSQPDDAALPVAEITQAELERLMALDLRALLQTLSELVQVVRFLHALLDEGDEFNDVRGHC